MQNKKKLSIMKLKPGSGALFRYSTAPGPARKIRNTSKVTNE